MPMSALPATTDARFQAMLARALEVPHDELAERAMRCAIDLEACKRELGSAQDWVACNRSKWMGPSGMALVAAATSRAVAAAHARLPNGWALGLTVAHPVIFGDVAM